jgi:hypothetical protein
MLGSDAAECKTDMVLQSGGALTRTAKKVVQHGRWTTFFAV